MPHALNGLRVVSFESRRAAEMAELIRNYGGEPIQAPAMREVPLTDQREAFAIAALKEVGLAPALAVPEPNTWRDLLSELGRKLPIARKRVAVQEYGARNEELLAGLRKRGARVTAVPVYGWALPEDMRPLRAAIDRLAAGEVEVALFTSAHQADNLFLVAAQMERADALRDALRGRTVVVSIGPITTEALQGHGIQPDLHPEHPKMGHLLIAVAREAGNLLRRKRGG
jgi:uroporphyrinogen-III synthase